MADEPKTAPVSPAAPGGLPPSEFPKNPQTDAEKDAAKKRQDALTEQLQATKRDTALRRQAVEFDSRLTTDDHTGQHPAQPYKSQDMESLKVGDHARVKLSEGEEVDTVEIGKKNAPATDVAVVGVGLPSVDSASAGHGNDAGTLGDALRDAAGKSGEQAPPAPGLEVKTGGDSKGALPKPEGGEEKREQPKPETLPQGGGANLPRDPDPSKPDTKPDGSKGDAAHPPADKPK